MAKAVKSLAARDAPRSKLRLAVLRALGDRRGIARWGAARPKIAAVLHGDDGTS